MKFSLITFLASFIFPLIPLESTDGKSPTPLEQKLKDIQIPGVQFLESPLNEVMTELQRQSKKFDLKEKDPAKKGLNIITLKHAEEPFPKVTITLNNMPLGQMIAFITEMVKWTYDIRADAVVISMSVGAFKGIPLETEFYELTQVTIVRMTGGAAGTRGDNGADPFQPSGLEGEDQGSKIKQFLERTGIPFDETKGHKFVFDGFQMIVTHERSSLDLIENVLRNLDAGFNRQVSVTFRVLETPLGLIDQVLAETAKAEDDKKFSSIIEREHAERLIEGLLKAKDVELLHAPNLLIMDGQPTQYSSAQEVIYPTDFIPPLESNQSKPSQPIAQFDTVAPDDEQPGFRQVGLIIALTSRVEKYQTISLELNPKLTRLTGYEEFGQGTKLPVFWAWQINTSVTLGPNETMISRGTSSEEKKEIIVFIEASILK
jgi:Flp pilus assembly secretin CpaC